MSLRVFHLCTFQKLTLIKFGPKEPPEGEFSITKGPNIFHTIANKTIWLISTARNAIIVVACGFIGHAVYTEGEEPPIQLIRDVPPGLPDVQVPPFGMTSDNVTYTLAEMASTLSSGIIVVPIIALLETIAICKAFGTANCFNLETKHKSKIYSFFANFKLALSNHKTFSF